MHQDSDPHHRLRRPAWLRHIPYESQRAETIARRWRRPLVLCLLITIPAFYAELVTGDGPVPYRLSSLVYALAAVVLAAAALHTASAAGRNAPHLQHNVLDMALVCGLLAAALLPAMGDDEPATLALHMAVALVTLFRIGWTLRHLVSRGSTAYLMGMALAVLLLSGVGFWWLEPETPTLADGLWLAFTTAATVGYGDVVPTTLASKTFSVLVVLLGYGVLTLVTAAIASTWVESDERRVEREILHDLHEQMRALRSEIRALRRERGSAAPDDER